MRPSTSVLPKNCVRASSSAAANANFYAANTATAETRNDRNSASLSAGVKISDMMMTTGLKSKRYIPAVLTMPRASRTAVSWAAGVRATQMEPLNCSKLRRAHPIHVA